MIPTTREEFAQFCLRKIGAGPNQINITDEQVDDRIDESLSLYWDYHYDGSERLYYKHKITAEDKINKYIYLPENIIGAVRIFPLSALSNYTTGEPLFDGKYQVAVNELYSFRGFDLITYSMAMTQIALIEEMLVSKPSIRYTKDKNKLYIDANWKKYGVGDYFIVEAHQIIDPEIYPDVWKNRWLQNYTAAKLQEQWGLNLIKFKDMSLVGGVSFNAHAILSEGKENIEKLERELRNMALPPVDMIG